MIDTAHTRSLLPSLIDTKCVNYAGGAAQSEEVPNSSISSSASVAERGLCLALCYV